MFVEMSQRCLAFQSIRSQIFVILEKKSVHMSFDGALSMH